MTLIADILFTALSELISSLLAAPVTIVTDVLVALVTGLFA